ncbi:MAG TPA: cytochrome c3 family protein [Kofleriaceae bacterium]|nr:cytochrome c3 family protein [Kofleriaceae bacterium]
MPVRIALAIAVAAVLVACSAAPPRPIEPPRPVTLTYAGSEACRPCHAAIYDRWKVTRMANVVRDPKTHPDAIIPDLTKPDPLLTFGVADIAFVYGSRWKQRYFTKKGDDYFPLPAQWDIEHKTWRPYHVPDTADWWVKFYPVENLERPTGPLCDGCHSVDYDIRTKTPKEWNVGCEKCHGPGADHARAPTRANIINPSRLDPIAANDVCIQCHSQGRPLTPSIEGRAYDWPVGYRIGLPLRDFWQLEEHTLGDTTFTHFSDGSAHKNRMQGNDFVQSAMYTHAVTCWGCHDVHGTANPGLLVLPAGEVCGQCHSPGGPNGPRAKTLEGHTHHRAGSTGSACIACHMPKIAQTLGDVMVRSHTFRFVSPALTEHSKIPNPCASCHADRPDGWAAAALRRWSDTSPWRVAP